jgi:large subunit ribosomal protein L10
VEGRFCFKKPKDSTKEGGERHLAISKERKRDLVEQYKALLEEAQGIVITEYRGMNMNQLTALRMKLSESGGKYVVTKNTLLKIALEEAGMAAPEELITGPIAVGFAMTDIASDTKALLDASDDDALAIKVMGGIMGESVFDETQLEQLTKLPSLDEIRAQLAGMLTSPMTQIVGLLEAPARDVVGVLDAASSQLINVIAAYVAENEAKEAA